MFLAEAAARPERGWGNTVGMLAAFVVFYAIWRLEKAWRKRYGKDARPSPAEETAPLPVETRRSAPSHLTSHPDETPAETNEGHWAGHIVRDSRGVGRRVFQNARHIARTGESLPIEELSQGDVLDDAPGTDVEPYDFNGDFEADGEVEAYHEAPAAVTTTLETREQYAARCIALGKAKAETVAALQKHYRLPRATAYRVFDRADAARK